MLQCDSPVVGSIVLNENSKDVSYKSKTAAEVVALILGIKDIG